MTVWIDESRLPSEDEEEATFTEWLDLNHYVHWHVPQETYTTSWKVKMHAKKLGVRKGVSDHWVIVPSNGAFFLVAIEMKRQKGGTISDEQFEMTHQLNKCRGVHAFVAEGCGEAITIVTLVRDGDWETLKELEERFEKKREKRLKTREKRENLKKSCHF